MGSYRDCGDQDRYTLGISTEPRGSDLFICIGHGGYNEKAARFTTVPDGSQIYFYNGHDTALDSEQVEDLLANPLGSVIAPVKSIAGGAARVWDYAIKPFNLLQKGDSKLPKQYLMAWGDMAAKPGHPTNDVLVMNIYSNVYKSQSTELVHLSDIINLVPGYTRYHWCCCRKIFGVAEDSFRSYNQKLSAT